MQSHWTDNHQGKRRGVGWKISSLLSIYLLLAALFNVAWHLVRLPPQMVHGVLNPALMLLSGIILLGVILAASAWTLRLFEQRSLTTVGVPFSGAWAPQILIGLVAGSVTPLLYVAVAYKLGSAHIERVALDTNQILTQTLVALAAILLLAFHEELLYRGYLLQMISQKTSRMTAAAITGVLFGLVHAGNSAANPQGLFFTAVGGVLLAWLVMRNGSLWMAGGYHLGWNATASLALGLSVSGTSMPGSWITTTLTGPRWLSGGSYGFESSILTGLIEPIVLGTLVWMAPLLPSNPELRQYFKRPSAV